MEHFRVRYVNIFYYLEDDTLQVIEPVVKVRFMFLSREIEASHSSVLLELRIVAGKARAPRQDIEKLWKLLFVERF